MGDLGIINNLVHFVVFILVFANHKAERVFFQKSWHGGIDRDYYIVVMTMMGPSAARIIFSLDATVFEAAFGCLFVGNSIL